MLLTLGRGLAPGGTSVRGRIRERSGALVRAELVAFVVEGTDVVELTGQGARYPKRRYDADSFPLSGPAPRVVYGRAQIGETQKPPRCIHRCVNER